MVMGKIQQRLNTNHNRYFVVKLQLDSEIRYYFLKFVSRISKFGIPKSLKNFLLYILFCILLQF